MLPSQLQPESFKSYPPKAKAICVAEIDVLRRLPAIFVTVLLRELITYDWKFPAEREEMDRQIRFLRSLDREQTASVFAKFSQIRLDPQLEELDWVNQPSLFSERLTAFLWSSHQLDAFRAAATDYQAAGQKVAPVNPPPMQRLSIALIGKGVDQSGIPLFRKLRPHGVYFTQMDPRNGLPMLLDAVSARAGTHALPYAHWYLDGAKAESVAAGVTTVSWDALQPVRAALLDRMQQIIHSGSGGPELLETTMAKITPEELGMHGGLRDGVLNRFQVSLLTEGSGTQIFSTTFVQWTAREAYRRAQPCTLLARFTPRQRQRPMNELLDGKQTPIEFDPQGSLVDADMGAYYMWLDQQRLPGADRSAFLVWFEDHNEALAIGPGLPRGVESTTPATLHQLLQWIS